MSRRNARRTRRRLWLALGFVVVLVFSVFPVFVMLSTAVDPSANSGSRNVLPTGFTLDHFRFVLDEGNFLTYLRNSVLVALATVLASSVLALFAAVAVARFRFRMRIPVLMLILTIQMVPMEALVIPLFLQAKTLGLLDQLLGLVVVYVAFSLPFAIWTLRGFVAAVPVELEEAAALDGASWWQMFWRILFPLVAPGLVATSIFSFIVAWNEFIFALTFMSDSDLYTVAVGLRQFFTRNGANWGAVMAGSAIITVPVMIFFVAVQRKLTSGLIAGATKG
ncbi:MAG: carbohydrate ABC transporter permease [Actinomycetota bacterium]|nr:carbohydrate ABC transporter permease [Actinomycetota bacterium]MDQ3527563.1 carbohydrate ABC transporter permease [Actinomycetota bacterium]